jgi:hypothetical protein
MSKQPRDDGNAAIPVLSFKPAGGQRIELSDVSTLSSAFANNVRVVSLYSTDDCYFEVGDSSVQANETTSHFLPAGIYIDVSLGSSLVSSENAKHIAAVGATGTLHISERI